MSTVWGTRYRLLREQLDHLADWLGADRPRRSGVREEQTARLLMGVIRLLRQHRVNQRGQCRFCGRTRQDGFGRWPLLWHRRPRCTVYRAFDFAMGQPLDVVWWQLRESTGHEILLTEVRQWLKHRAPSVHDNEDTVEFERTNE